MKYGARSFPSGTAVMSMGGRHVAGVESDEAQESCPWAKPALKVWFAAAVASTALFETPGAIKVHPRFPARLPGRSSRRRIGSDQIHDAARQQVAEQPEAGPQDGLRSDLPSQRGPRLKDPPGRGLEDIAQVGLNQRAQRLVYIVRNGSNDPGRRATASWGLSGLEL